MLISGEGSRSTPVLFLCLLNISSDLSCSVPWKITDDKGDLEFG